MRWLKGQNPRDTCTYLAVEGLGKLTWPRLPQILAWIEGYICFSFIVMVMSLSKMAVTRWRLASSLCLQKRTRLSSQGVMYSKQRCFSSMPAREQQHLELTVYFNVNNISLYCQKYSMVLSSNTYELKFIY